MENMRNHRRLRRIEGTVGKVFILCMIVFFLLNLIISDKEMSEEEKSRIWLIRYRISTTRDFRTGASEDKT